MKTPSKLFALLALLFLGFAKPIEKPETNVPSFENDVFPIIKEKCNVKDCHNVQRANPIYTHYDGVKKQAKRILVRIKNRSIPMPPRESGIVLTKAEIATIEAWIKAGAPKN